MFIVTTMYRSNLSNKALFIEKKCIALKKAIQKFNRKEKYHVHVMDSTRDRENLNWPGS
jgi:hypothetical protein